MRERIRDMHFMLQKEVVERMVARPGRRRLRPPVGDAAIPLRHGAAARRCRLTRSRRRRKVDSAVVRMRPRPQAALAARNEVSVCAQVVRRAFAQRRKTLRNSLAGLLQAGDYAALGIAPGLRAENLAVADFVAISNYLGKKDKSMEA